MAALDTLKVILPAHAVVACDLAEWEEIRRPVRDAQGMVADVSRIFRSNRRGEGGAWAQYVPELDEWRLEFSAKTLGERYPEGLCPDTLPLALDSIRRRNALEIDPEAFLEGQVLRADPCVNIRPRCGVVQALEALKAVAWWPRKSLDARFGNSVLWWNSVEELNAYDKRAEVSQWDADMGERFAGVLRVEWRGKRANVLCKRFGTPQPTDRFQSQEAPAVERFLTVREALQPEAVRGALLDAWDSLRLRESPGPLPHDASIFDLTVPVRYSVRDAQTGERETVTGYKRPEPKEFLAVLGAYALTRTFDDAAIRENIERVWGSSPEAVRGIVKRIRDRAAILKTGPDLLETVSELRELVAVA